MLAPSGSSPLTSAACVTPRHTDDALGPLSLMAPSLEVRADIECNAEIAQSIGEAGSAHDALAVLSSKWSVDVLVTLRNRPLHFGLLCRRLDTVTRKVLTQTLRAMERDGLLWRTSTGRVGMPVAYGLTPLGYALLDALSSFEKWSRGHMATVRATRVAFDAREPARARYFKSAVRA